MKELSIEDKAKRYDEAIEVANNLYKDAITMENNMTAKTCEIIFPELKESEDDNIRKALIDVLNSDFEKDTEIHGITVGTIIAWLEKQGNNMGIPESTKKKLEDNLNKALEKETPKSWNDFLEKQGEQKTVDKVEPFDIFEGLTDFERTLADICIGWVGEELGWKQYIKDNADVLLKIAVKKFNSVQDAPFEQKPAWSEEDKKKLDRIFMLLAEAADEHAFSTTCRLIGDKECVELQDFLRSLKPQPKQEWSEKDKDFMYDTLSSLTELKDRYGEGYGNVGKCIDWFKSLKDRCTWKPSDEQMKALKGATNIVGSKYKSHLNSLYSDLKKLKE